MAYLSRYIEGTAVHQRIPAGLTLVPARGPLFDLYFDFMCGAPASVDNLIMQHKRIIETRTALDTPEGVQLTFHLAGPGRRLAAYVLDFSCRVILGLVIALGLLLFLGSLGLGELSVAIILVTMFALEWFYGTLFEWLWNGRTPGKRMCGIRVLKDGGYPIGFYEAVLRNFLRAADAPFLFLYGIGLLTMMSTRRMQRLGDIVAGTMVVVEQRERVRFKPRDLQLVPELKRSECRRGFHVSERTLDIITRLFERTGYLSGPRREAIATILAEPIADRLGFDLLTMPPRDRGSRFLIRVIKTFSPTEENDDQWNDVFELFQDEDSEDRDTIPMLQTGGSS